MYFHNEQLYLLKDEHMKDVPFAILNSRREAYKSSFSTNTTIVEKFVDIPLAREIATYVWDKKYIEYLFSSSEYDNIRFIFSTEQNIQKISSAIYRITQKGFYRRRY